MKNINTKVFLTILCMAFIPFMMSCSAPIAKHDVYFVISGNAASVDVDIATYDSSPDIFSYSPMDSLSTTIANLPWTSSTYELETGNVAYISCEIYDNVTINPTIKIEIYKDGTLSKSVEVSGSYGSASMQLEL